MQIIADGYLRPRPAACPAAEKPIVWFTMHQVAEPSIAKAVRTSSGITRLTLRQTHEQGGGLWRFGIVPEALLGWRKLRVAAGITRDEARKAEAMVRGYELSILSWLGSLEPMPIDSCIVQAIHVRDSLDAWEGVPDARQWREDALTDAIRQELPR